MSALTHYDILSHGVNLSNRMDIIANSYAVIEENRIINIRDLLPGGSQTATPIDAYAKTQTDAK
jgi:hypothetical protein